MGWYLAESRQPNLNHELVHGAGVRVEGYETSRPIYMYLVELDDQAIARLERLVDEDGRVKKRLAFPGVHNWWFALTGKARWPGTSIRSTELRSADGRRLPRALGNDQLETIRASQATRTQASSASSWIDSLQGELRSSFDTVRIESDDANVFIADEPIAIEELMSEVAAQQTMRADSLPEMSDSWRRALVDSHSELGALVQIRELLRLDSGDARYALELLDFGGVRGYICVGPADDESWPWLAIASIEPRSPGTVALFLSDFIESRGSGYGVDAFFPGHSIASGSALMLMRSGGFLSRGDLRDALLPWLSEENDWQKLRADLEQTVRERNSSGVSLPDTSGELLDAYLDTALTEMQWPVDKFDKTAELAATQPSRRRPVLGRSEFLKQLSEDESPAVAEACDRFMKTLSEQPGVFWQPREAAFSARLRDPRGSRQNISLFSLTLRSRTRAEEGLHFGYMRTHLRRRDLSTDACDNFYEKIDGLFHVGFYEAPSYLDDRYPNPVGYEKFVARLDEVTSAVVETAEEIARSATAVRTSVT